MERMLRISKKVNEELLVPKAIEVVASSEETSLRAHKSIPILKAHRIAGSLIPTDIVPTGWLKRGTCPPRTLCYSLSMNRFRERKAPLLSECERPSLL
jgi:hypothetical protein